jgi:hypothetical protein
MKENLEICRAHLDVHQISTINTRWTVKTRLRTKRFTKVNKRQTTNVIDELT